MHLSARAYVLLVLTAALWLGSLWSGDPLCVLAWPWIACFLLAGLAWEGMDLRALRLAGRVAPAARLFAGRTAPAALSIESSPRRVVDLALALAAPAGITVRAPSGLRLDRAAERGVPIELTAVALGVQHWPSSAARVRGRLGLAWWDKNIVLQQTTRVAPDARFLSRRRASGVHGLRPRSVAGAGSELHQLRGYAPGDAPARIDWKASARRGSLMTRELSDDQCLDIVLAIDAGRLSRVRSGALERLSLYGNIAVRFAAGATAHDDRIGLVVYADRVLSALPPARGAAALLRVCATLEQLDAQPAQSEPLAAALWVRGLLRHRGLVVLLTDLDDASMADQLSLALRMLAPPHQVIVAAIESRGVETLARRPARHWLDPYIGLAAREQHVHAAAQRRLLGRLGVPVVAAPEESIADAVLETYQRLRRARRI